mmetsp:Transcript_10011/g.21036  ORF Transcript_10011/g.21036 Transcript_10011/m.21036 type:complete len:220 (-) Transcript_10011:63-722(-)
MHWPSRKGAGDGAAAGVADAPPPPTGGSAFSAPPAADAPTSRFSAPPPALPPIGEEAVPTRSSIYEDRNLSKYAASTYETDGLRDDSYLRKRSSNDGNWITHPRARQCINNIQLGAKMGASVGGCFGLLTGAWVAISQRNILVLPVSVVGGALSFGFFLGCGMIIRCEEKKTSLALANEATPVAPSTGPATFSSTAASWPATIARRRVLASPGPWRIEE